MTTNSTGYSYTKGNRLGYETAGAWSYYYDGAGRLTNQTAGAPKRSFTYSFRSQMTSLTDTNAATFTYEFDGDGNRTKAGTSGCLTSRYVYDGPNVVLDLNASNQVVNAYVNGLGIDQPVERIAFVAGTPTTRLVYHTDGLGSVVALTDSAQSAVKSYTYEAFGKIRSETGNSLVVNRYMYTAREALGDSLGLYYYRRRVMDPNMGRFTSEDPLGFVDGPNEYFYTKNNPVLYRDAFGERSRLNLASCLAIAGRDYRDELRQADRALDDCLAACPECPASEAQACIDNCVTISNLSASIAATRYASRSLACLTPIFPLPGRWDNPPWI